MASGARFCQTLLDNLCTRRTLRMPSEDMHNSWQDFAINVAPRIHRRQTDVSRIICVAVLLAVQNDVVPSHASVLVRVTSSPGPEEIRAGRFGQMKAGAFLDKMRKEHPWVEPMCAALFELKKLHDHLGHVSKPERVFNTYAEAKQYKLVRVLQHLDREEFFHPGTLMDSLIDLDTCRDTILLLQQTVDTVRKILQMG